MRASQATGLQVAFLIFAATLLSVPIAGLLARLGGLTADWKELVGKGTQFMVAIAVIAAFPALRRIASCELSVPIPAVRRVEVVLVAAGNLTLALAAAGGLALWNLHTQGVAGLERTTVNVDRELANAFSPAGLIRNVILVGLVAPVVEELVFRGFVYRAFERQWGWVVSMLVTSVLFGAYHPHFGSAFASSIVFICVLRRTGSLRAPIAVHMLFNLMLWWPLLGQYVFPHGDVSGNLATWRIHVACLAFAAAALPIYVWMSRDRNACAPTAFLEPHAALPK